MSEDKPGCTPLSYWQKTHNENDILTTAFEINLHDNITQEQLKRQLEITPQSKSDKKSKTTIKKPSKNKETIEKMKDNQKKQKIHTLKSNRL